MEGCFRGGSVDYFILFYSFFGFILSCLILLHNCRICFVFEILCCGGEEGEGCVCICTLHVRTGLLGYFPFHLELM